MRNEIKRYYDINYRGFDLPGFRTMSIYQVLSRVVQLFYDGTKRFRPAAISADEMTGLLMDELSHSKEDTQALHGLLRDWIGKRLLLEREGEALGPNPIHYRTASMYVCDDPEVERSSEMLYNILRTDPIIRKFFNRYFTPQRDDNAEEELLVRLAGRLPLADEDPARAPEETNVSICPAFRRMVVDDFRRVFSYSEHLSRGTFVRLLENLVGLHLATYEMLVTNIVNNFVSRGVFCPQNCPVAPEASDLKGCFCVDGVFGSSDSKMESFCQVAIRSFTSKIEKHRAFLQNIALMRKLEQYNGDGFEFLKEPAFKEKPLPADLLTLKEHPDLDSWLDAESILLTEEETAGRKTMFGLLDETEIEPRLRLISKLLTVLGPANDANYARRLERMLGYSDGFGLLASFRGSFMYYLSDKFIGFTVMLATVEKDAAGKYQISKEISLADYCNFLRQRYGINVGGRYKGGYPGQGILRENIAVLHRRLFYMGYVSDPLNRPVNPIIRPDIAIER
ncbi:MAG: hypothetical protein WC712_11380 [Candidatus Brocadiia bacterium]